MHTCQIMLVEADTVDEAFNNVFSALTEAPSWSDWHNADNPRSHNFSGRWAGQIFWQNPDKVDEENAPNYLQYSADPALAERVLSEYLDYRLMAIQQCRTKGVDLATHTYDPYAKDSGMGIWYTNKLAELLNDSWNYESAIYDLEDYTANLSGFIERVKKSPEKQWLIPVDFHH
jgi:hypothetical protein